MKKIDWFMLSLPVLFFIAFLYQMIDTKEVINVKTINSVAEYEMNIYDHQYLFYPKDSGKDLYIYVKDDGVLYLSYVDGLTMRNGDMIEENAQIDMSHYAVEKGDVYKLTLPEINQAIGNVDAQIALGITAYVLME